MINDAINLRCTNGDGGVSLQVLSHFSRRFVCLAVEYNKHLTYSAERAIKGHMRAEHFLFCAQGRFLHRESVQLQPTISHAAQLFANCIYSLAVESDEMELIIDGVETTARCCRKVYGTLSSRGHIKVVFHQRFFTPKHGPIAWFY